MLRVFLACFCILTLPVKVALASKSNADSDLVHWHDPEVEQAVDAFHIRVLISGNAKPGTKIQVENGVIAVFHGKDVRDLSLEDLALKSPDIVSNAVGTFSVSMVLPYANVEIPVTATADHSHVKHYLLLLNVDERSIHMTDNMREWRANRWKVYVGPTLKFFNWLQSNSIFSPSHGSLLTGSTVAVGYALKDKTRLSLALTSVQGNGSLSSTSSYTFSDFEYALEYIHLYNWQPIQRVTIASDLTYRLGNTPIFGRDSAANYTFDTATLNNFAIGLTGFFSLRHQLDSAFSLGLLYGFVGSGGIHSTSNLIGGHTRFLITYPIERPFYFFGDISFQYETFAFSAYDPPSRSSVANTVYQNIMTINAGIQCLF